MKDSPSFTGTLNDSPAAEALRKAIGADPGEEVTFVTPQFTRQRGAPMPGQPPTTLEEWTDYAALSMDDLKALGFGNWDGGLALIPGEWHSRLPVGLVLDGIGGGKVTVGTDYVDDDIRFGCLAYGIRIGPATDGCDE